MRNYEVFGAPVVGAVGGLFAQMWSLALTAPGSRGVLAGQRYGVSSRTEDSVRV